jgi:hypothetical protein
MASDTEIANIALGHLGNGKDIQNLTSDQSDEATACRRFFDLARDSTLRDYPWPFATKIADLALVESSPNDEWDYSYRYPTDCLNLRRIRSGQRNDTRDTRASFMVTRDAAGRLIYSDEATASLEYTMRNEDPSQYPDDFVLAMSFRLAYYIAPRVTGGDPFNLQERMLKNYEMELTRAVRTNINEEQVDAEPDSSLERSRI